MAITVITATDTVAIPDGTGWHVDDRGYLHILKAGEGNAATFHAQAWQSVERGTRHELIGRAA